jgi:hypothetical protein
VGKVVDDTVVNDQLADERVDERVDESSHIEPKHVDESSHIEPKHKEKELLTPPSDSTKEPTEQLSDYNAILLEVFRLIDTNSNGSIEKTELMLALRPNNKAYKMIQASEYLVPLLQPRHIGATFKEMATTTPGSVTMEEFVAYATRVVEVEDVDRQEKIAAIEKEITETAKLRDERVHMLRESVEYAEDEATLSTLLEMIPTNEDPRFVLLSKQAKEKLDKLKTQEVEGDSTVSLDQMLTTTADIDGRAPMAEVMDGPALPDLLPDGWEEHTDEESGAPYFYNTISGAQVWERPVAVENTVAEDDNNRTEVAGEDGAPIVANEKTGDIEDENGAVAKVEALVFTVDDVEDAGIGTSAGAGEVVEEGEINVEKTVVVEEGGTVLEEAVVISEAENVNNNSDIGEKEEIVVATGEDQEETPLTLPKGWAPLTDEESGAIYYFNEVTGEQVWEIPTEEQVVQVEATEPVEVQEEMKILPDGWVEYKDEENNVYYYNTITAEQQWEIPTESAGIMSEV